MNSGGSGRRGGEDPWGGRAFSFSVPRSVALPRGSNGDGVRAGVHRGPRGPERPEPTPRHRLHAPPVRASRLPPSRPSLLSRRRFGSMMERRLELHAVRAPRRTFGPLPSRRLRSLLRDGHSIADVWESTVDLWEAKEALVFHRDVFSFLTLDQGAARATPAKPSHPPASPSHSRVFSTCAPLCRVLRSAVAGLRSGEPGGALGAA